MLTMQQPLYSETEVKALGTKHKKTGNFMSVGHVARKAKHQFRPRLLPRKMHSSFLPFSNRPSDKKLGGKNQEGWKR